MVKYENHIYLKICEVTLELYPETNYSTYAKYCEGLYNSLNTRTLRPLFIRHVSIIIEWVNKYFSLDDVSVFIYLMKFLQLKKFVSMAYPVKAAKKLYKIKQ